MSPALRKQIEIAVVELEAQKILVEEDDLGERPAYESRISGRRCALDEGMRDFARKKLSFGGVVTAVDGDGILPAAYHGSL